MKYGIEEADQFLKDVEEAAVWILLNTIEQSESLAEKKVDDLSAEISALKKRLQEFPESGAADSISGIRRFPIYDGRYSAKWIVNQITRTVTLVALADSRYPQNLREFHLDE